MKRTSSRAQSPEARLYHALYYTPRWRRERAQHLAREPLCRMCARAGRSTKAVVVDHIIPHRGDLTLFWDPINRQSLCLVHGNGEKQRIENGGKPRLPIGPDGWPL
jgi:5-methylcytosine-specific restriction enzyme A